MAPPVVPEEELLAAMAALRRAGGNRRAAAKALGIPASRMYKWVALARDRGIDVPEAGARDVAPGVEAGPASKIDLPDLPSGEVDVEVILDGLRKRWHARHAGYTARKWFAINVRDELPIALLWFGDPHLGNEGSNLPLLEHHAQIARETPGIYGANIGDTVDNWGGRLTRLYAEHDISRASERALARWFLEKLGIRWALWLHGNHDVWDSAFAVYMEAVGAKLVTMIDWRARFKLVFPCGTEFRVDAAHNHKGHSMWHELHGQVRASLFDEYAHLFIAGHHHNWAIMQRETAHGVVTLARARGYKHIDPHAEHHGYHNHRHGSAILTIFDPGSPCPSHAVRAFPDPAEGAEFLTWLRGRRSR